MKTVPLSFLALLVASCSTMSTQSLVDSSQPLIPCPTAEARAAFTQEAAAVFCQEQAKLELERVEALSEIDIEACKVGGGSVQEVGMFGMPVCVIAVDAAPRKP